MPNEYNSTSNSTPGSTSGSNPTNPVKTNPSVTYINTQNLAAINMQNFFTFISLFSPYLIVFLLLLNTIINSNVKGLIYICGIALLFIIVIGFQKLLMITNTHVPDPMCNTFNLNLSLYSVPSFSVSLITYTLVYLLLPMVQNKSLNYPFIVILNFVLILNIIYRIKNNCTTILGAITGGFLGFVWGVLFYFIIRSSDPKLTYYDDILSNKVACSKPSEQKFKCSVYKNGELLQTI